MTCGYSFGGRASTMTDNEVASVLSVEASENRIVETASAARAAPAPMVSAPITTMGAITGPRNFRMELVIMELIMGWSLFFGQLRLKLFANLLEFAFQEHVVGAAELAG